MNYHFRIHRESQARKGYWATCLELPGCSTQGDTLDELLSNMSEALNLYLSEPEGTRVVFAPPGRYSGKNIREVAVDPHVAFAVQLRNLRLKHGLTQKQLAARLGIRGLYT
jgi:predicted RNase H-like HicB family nuclease